MKGVKLYLVLWFALGMFYLFLEGIWRGGWTHVSMMFVGGICGVLIGAVNQIPRFYRLRMVWQSFIGTVIVLIVEFISGCVINLWWGWGIWDYTGRFGNVLGQICIPYALLWFAIMPFAIWLEDTLRYILGDDTEYGRYTLVSVYKELLTGK